MDQARIVENIRHLTAVKFRNFGVNKSREIERLIYEISKRDGIDCKKIIGRLPNGKTSDYNSIKKELLRQRFPYSYSQENGLNPYLPRLSIDPKNAAIISNKKFYPREVYIEEAARHGGLAKRLRNSFPLADFKTIESLKSFISRKPSFSILDYNKRRDRLFVINEKYDFFKRCPCTKKAVSCGYHIFNLGFGCIFECTYCYLQEYTNCPGIILPSNIEAFFDNFRTYKKPHMRIGTGEFTDSLALDNITQYSLPLVSFFGKFRDITFEFKTKSCNIGNLLKASHAGNIVVSWSLSPQRLIRNNEFYTPSLENRLKAALECVRAGYGVGFHFDPIIYNKNWEGEYAETVNRLFDRIPHRKIAWISLGTFRFNPRLKTIIENRFPNNKILDEELSIGFDNKLRYPEKMRSLIYQNMLYWIRKRAKKVNAYLCMEGREMIGPG